MFDAPAVLPVAPALAAALPRGGLTRGSVVSVQGQGATSLLFTLLAGPGGGAAGCWSALVGMPGLGLAAAAELGVDLNRVVLVPDPGADALQVVSILIDGVDLVAVALPGAARLAPARQRVIGGRLRQRGAVLLVVGPWPGADLVLTARSAGWQGLGRGHGRLRDRSLAVRIDGRRAGGRGASVDLLLHADRDAVRIAPAVPAAAPVVARVS